MVLSPGGPADTPYGYEVFAQRFATWGFVVAIVAFNGNTADERGKEFPEILDWFEKHNADSGSALKGKIDAKKYVACGHSRGGWAAIVAATTEKRFAYCLALAPAAPVNLPGDKRPPVCIVSGDSEPADVASAKTTFKLFEKPKFQITVRGVPHMLHKDPKTPIVCAYATAFLNYKVRGDAHSKKFLEAQTADVSVVSEE
ncbi:hypothetical protein HY251_11645 [bacterium]|nr:hypothetical protein [bacterium]